MISVLTPLFLAAGVVLAVPILLHLIRARRGERLSFPALRYLQRSTRDRAREIRLRQWLLLALRTLILACFVLAGARLHLGSGGAHPPTALAIVIDNSASSGLVQEDRRVLDRLRAHALESVAEATDQDRIWILPSADPSSLTLPSTPDGAAERIRALAPLPSGGNLETALSRARRLVEAAGLPHQEIHLFSDLQRSELGWRPAPNPGGPPIVVAPPEADAGENRYLTLPMLAGGLPPLEGEQATVVVSHQRDPADGEDGPPPSVRLFMDGSLTRSVQAPRGEPVLLPLPPRGPGWVEGWVETDPSGLLADDRRYFAFAVRSPPVVERAGEPAVFVDEALQVLADEGRLFAPAGGPSPSDPVPDLLVTVGGAELGRGAPMALVFPGRDPLLLPGLNRALADAGIGWRLGEEAPGPVVTLDADGGAPGLPSLEGVRVSRRFRLLGEAPGDTDLVLELPGGEPWGVLARGRNGSVLLLATPADPDWISLPVTASWLPFLEAVAGGFSGEPGAASGTAISRPATGTLTAPDGATRARLPDGTLLALSGIQGSVPTPEPGLYRFLAGDSLLSVVAVNIPLQESILSRVGTDEIVDMIGPTAVTPAPDEPWRAAVFQARAGHEGVGALLAFGLFLLLCEGWMAAGRRAARRPASSPSPRFD